MGNPQPPVEIVGSEAVVEWFGYWPEFHDAEIISLHLVRMGESVLRVYPCNPKKPAMVDFVLEQVTDLELADFSVQNVINSLITEPVKDQTGHAAVRIRLGGCFGLSGWIDARRVRVQLIPGKPSDAV